MTLMEEIRQTEKEIAEGGEFHLDPAIVSALIIARAISASSKRISNEIGNRLLEIAQSIDTQGGK